MTDKELERRLELALSAAAPDDLEGVLSRCEARKGTVIPMTKKRPSRTIRNLMAACLALALVGGGGGAFYYQANAVASVVSLDVNPSIELKVNKREKVLSCIPLNEEARTVLSSMGDGADLKGTKLDVAVNAIVGALVSNGYLDSISSAIMISVEDKDQARAVKLQQELTGAVDAVLQAQASNASILSQTVDASVELDQQAKANNISTGKASLVNQVIALNSDLKFEELAQLSVEELKDLAKIGAPAMPIGKEAAFIAAEEYAGTMAVSSVVADVDPELDDRVPHYEVELKTVRGEFEYHIDAWTGEVLSGQKDILASGQSGGAGTKPSSGSSDIGQEKAKEAALKHAGVSESQVSGLRVQQDWDDGRLEYEVEFWVDTTEYDYTIAAADGSVLKQERETHRAPNYSGSGTGGSGTQDVGAEAAKSAALKPAGVSESQATDVKVKQDWDDGRLEYEVEFWVGSTEYDYTIDAVDGSVVAYDTEKHASASSTDIGAEAAESAALGHAGLSESQVAGLRSERDYDDGRLEYEVEFRSGGMEYEYTIDGASGAILEYEKDWDD